MRQAGITKPVSPHTLWHSFATHLYDGGADILNIGRMLRHQASPPRRSIHISRQYIFGRPINATTPGHKRPTYPVRRHAAPQFWKPLRTSARVGVAYRVLSIERRRRLWRVRKLLGNLQGNRKQQANSPATCDANYGLLVFLKKILFRGMAGASPVGRVDFHTLFAHGGSPFRIRTCGYFANFP